MHKTDFQVTPCNPPTTRTPNLPFIYSRENFMWNQSISKRNFSGLQITHHKFVVNSFALVKRFFSLLGVELKSHNHHVCGWMRDLWAWFCVLVEVKNLVNIFSMLQEKIPASSLISTAFVQSCAVIERFSLACGHRNRKFRKHESARFSCLSSKKSDAEIQEPDFHASWIKRLVNIHEYS